MTIALTHSWYMAVRQLRNLVRQPWYIGFTLVQPIIYLLLFAELFKRVVEIPGFGAGSYLAFLTPGIVIMTALFSAGWNGMGVVMDMDRGVMDRFLVAPASRVALIAGRLISLAVIIVIQSLIIIGLGYVRGANYSGGILGMVVLIGCAVLLAAPFGALSNAMALVARQEESVIGAVNFVLLPLTFLSSVFMAQSLMPSWMRSVAQFNPVNWAVQAGRAGLSAQPDWGFVFARLGWLFLLTLICGWIATRAFRAYQHSV
ncbi:MAG: ABC transporter permease [Chloroflexota bacterium]